MQEFLITPGLYLPNPRVNPRDLRSNCGIHGRESQQKGFAFKIAILILKMMIIHASDIPMFHLTVAGQQSDKPAVMHLGMYKPRWARQG